MNCEETHVKSKEENDMADPFVSEMRMFGFGWAPRSWAKCDGQLLAINQNETLFSLLGTAFGGDGRTTFGLPDMRGRAPMHGMGGGSVAMGARGGVESVTLTTEQMAGHTHEMKATTSNGNTKEFGGNMMAAGYDKRATKQQPVNMYGSATNLVNLNAQSVSTNGSDLSHDNMQPSIVVNFCIALLGVFPSRS